MDQICLIKLLGLVRMHDLTAVLDDFDALISFRPLQPTRNLVTKSALRAAAIIDVASEAHQILHHKRFFRLSDYLHLILSVLAGKTQPEHGAYALPRTAHVFVRFVMIDKH